MIFNTGDLFFYQRDTDWVVGRITNARCTFTGSRKWFVYIVINSNAFANKTEQVFDEFSDMCSKARLLQKVPTEVELLALIL